MKPYYERDGVTIYHGDCLSVMGGLDSGTVASLVTDPPYSSGARQSATMRNRGAMNRGTSGDWFGTDNLSAHGFLMLMRLLWAEGFRVTRVDGHLLSFIDWRQWPAVAGTLEAAGWTLRGCLVWDKVHFGMGNGFRQQAEFVAHASKGTGNNFTRHDLGTVFRHNRERSGEHPTQKPHKIVAEMMSAFPDGVVLDPFMGSGTTLVAAKKLNRPAIGIEIEERYCEIAAKRLDATPRNLFAEAAG